MNKQRLYLLIASGIGVLSVFLPWVTMPIIGSVNGARGDGFFILALYSISVALCLIGQHSERVKDLPLYSCVGAGLLASAILAYKIIDIGTSFNSIGDLEGLPFMQGLKASIGIGFGLYLSLITGIAISIVAYIYRYKVVFTYPEDTDTIE